MKPPISAFSARRAALARQIQAAGGGVAVLFSGVEVMRNRDSDYPFRSDSYFHYLSGFPEPEAAVVVVADATEVRSLLFCREKHEEREIWDGYRFGPAVAAQQFGFDAAYPIEELDKTLPTLLADRHVLFLPMGRDDQTDARARQWLARVREQARAGVTAPAHIMDVHQLLDDMRLIKDEHEIAIMRRAAEISAHAHCQAMRATRPGVHEYEVEAALLYEFRRHGSPFPAYGSIVAGGANACVLHYRSNDRQLEDGQLLLIDAGCELENYASDITRTFPVSGRFSDAQREIYEIVLAANEAAIDAVQPGHDFDAPHQAALRILVQGLIDLGLLEGPLEAALADGRYRRFYMHRTSHWLGMDVHDCGDYRERDAAGEGEPSWRILRPGMVLTIEPGLYIRAADDIDPRYHDIGVRIEDDVHVTADGHEVLTGDVPKHVSAIEALMRG
ncbi:MAG: aminopeptidase P N-terminal domain-containing protein [Burkholderiaceae bacterium]